MPNIADKDEYWVRYLPRMHELIALGLHMGMFLDEDICKVSDKGSSNPERDGLIACLKRVFPKRLFRLEGDFSWPDKPFAPFTIADHEREKKIGIGSLKILELNPRFGFDQHGVARIVNLLEYGEDEGRLEFAPGLTKAIRVLFDSEEGFEYDYYAILDLIKFRQIDDINEIDYYDKRDKCEAFRKHMNLTDSEFIDPFNTEIFLSPDDIFEIHDTYVEKAKSLGML